MESRTHLGGGEAVLREEARALKGGLLSSVDEAGHADLGRDVRQCCRRIPPAEALPQRLHKGRVGLGPGRLFRLGGGFFGREDIGLHCEGDGASGVRKGQLEVPRQTAERPAVGVDEERRPQPVGEAARLSVQGLPAPAARKAAALAKGLDVRPMPSGTVKISLSCARVRATYKSRICSLRISAAWTVERAV